MKVRQRLARRLDAAAARGIASARRVRARLSFRPYEHVTVRPLAQAGYRIRVTLDMDAQRAESQRLEAADAHLSGLLREGAL